MKTLVRPNVPAAVLLMLFFLLLSLCAHASSLEHQDARGLHDAVRHLCEDVLSGHTPDPERIQPIIAHVRAHGRESQSLFTYQNAPGAYQGFPIDLPMSRLVRLLYNPAIPQEVLKPFSIRSSVWTTPGAADQEVRLWTAWPPAEAIVIRGEQFDRTTPDPSTGGWYAMRLKRVILWLPQIRAVLSVSVQPEDSDTGRKGYVLGNDEKARYVYAEETGLTRTGLGWVDARIQTNVSIGVYVDQGGHVASGVFQWMRAGWSGLSVVRESHIRDSLTRYKNRMTARLKTLPEPEKLEALYAEVCALSTEQLRAQLSPVLDAWLRDDQGNQDAAKVLKNGYVDRLSRDEMVGMLMRTRLDVGEF